MIESVLLICAFVVIVVLCYFFKIMSRYRDIPQLSRSILVTENGLNCLKTRPKKSVRIDEASNCTLYFDNKESVKTLLESTESPPRPEEQKA